MSDQPQTLTNRVQFLQETVLRLSAEVKELELKLTQLDSFLLERVKEENSQLRNKVSVLEQALVALLHDAKRPRSTESLSLQASLMKQEAQELCRKANIKPELWKNIAS